MASSVPSVGASLREYGRGIVGGLLFSLPMVYTMELWWEGFTASPERLLTALVATLGMLLLYNRYAGLRASATWREVAIDSVEELGLGLVLAAASLWIVGQIGTGQGAAEVLGKVILEAMAVAVGVSVGTAQLGGSDGREQGMDAEGHDEPQHTLRSQIALAVCGAFLVAANIAPTDEVEVLAAEAPAFRLVVLALVSLALGGLTLFYADFRAARADADRAEILRGTVNTYAAALVTSALLLWFFGRFEGATLRHAAALIVVLGFPSVLGASAGRLLLTSSASSSDDGDAS